MDLTNALRGTRVVTRDGKELGSLKDVRARGFELNVHLAPDYWLPLEVVESVEAGRIQLRLAADDVDAYKMHPEAAGATGEVVVLEGTGSGIGGDAMLASDTLGSTVGWADVAPRFRERWQTRYETPGTWEEYEPGFHFAYDMGDDPRFKDRPWDEVEPELRAEYAAWAGRTGAQADEEAWDRVRHAARVAWDDRRAA